MVSVSLSSLSARGSVRGLLRYSSVGVLCTLLAACGSKKNPEDFIETPPEVLYNQGIAFIQQNDFSSAAEKFDQLDKEHPYSRLDQKALVMSSFSHYRRGQYEEAISSAQRYLTLYPGSEDAAYAQFLIMDSYFQQIPDVGRDQEFTRKAIQSATELVQRYPDSPYVESARKRLTVANDQLAGKEMETGRFYLNKRNYIAAINRFKVVVTDYQTTREIEEALERLTEAYFALGVVNEAQTAAAVLGHNYPESRWYRDAYTLLNSKGLQPREDSNSWISKAFKAVSF